MKVKDLANAWNVGGTKYVLVLSFLLLQASPGA